MVEAVQWDVDDRPPTWFTRLYILGMRLSRDKLAFEGEQRTLRTARSRQRTGNHRPTVLTWLRCRTTTTTIAGMTVWTVHPRRRRPIARVLYLHGGGYVHPITADYWRLVRALASSPAEVVVPAYALAPDSMVDDVLPGLIALQAEVDVGDIPTILMGDSAGGALAIVMSQQLRDAGQRTPAGVVALCPWLDATLDEESVVDLEVSDPMLSETGLRAAGRWWAGARSPSDPLVSPLQGTLDGLPPLDVVIGDRDILRPAVDDFVEVARRASIDLHVHEVRAMFHVWMTRAIPEGRRTRQDLSRLVRRRAN